MKGRQPLILLEKRSLKNMRIKLKDIFPLFIRLIKSAYNRCKFNNFGWLSILRSPLKINGASNIWIGNKVIIEYKSWLAAVSKSGGKAELIIEDGCTIGHFNHIYATKSVILHKNVLTADKVYISDNLHSYENVNIPIKNQPIKQIATVEIGEGSWIGENVCVLGAKIGKNCVIGANSVVNRNIPDFCVAVGAPARVIKRYNQDLKKWEKV